MNETKMTRRSVLLKVTSILNIIFGVLGTVAMSLIIRGLSPATETIGVELPDVLAVVAAIFGRNSALVRPTLIFSVITCLFIVTAGILGLALQSKRALFFTGIILMVLTFITLILTCVTVGLPPTFFIGLVLPFLYFLGAQKCVQ